jgi:serine kinase of HPr protein (carbohydrate metabolism regulator)
MSAGSTVHGSVLTVGPRAILIRGPAGAGKSRLLLALIEAADMRLIPYARLVADDRVMLEACHGRLLARPPAALAGLVEVRGLGIRRLPYEPVAVVGRVVDLAAADAQRLPAPAERQTVIDGVILPRLAVAAGSDARPAVLAWLRTMEVAVADP